MTANLGTNYYIPTEGQGFWNFLMIGICEQKDYVYWDQQSYGTMFLKMDPQRQSY